MAMSTRESQSGGVNIHGSVGEIHGDLVGGNKIGLDERELVSFLEARGIFIPKSAQTGFDPSTTPAERDRGRLSKYKQLFVRSAFEVPCIFENCLYRLYSANSQIREAVGTGVATSKEGNVSRALYEVPRRAEFETDEFIAITRQISMLLNLLEAEVSRLVETIGSRNPPTNSMLDVGPDLHMERVILNLIRTGAKRSEVVSMIREMDRIDYVRNRVLEMVGLPKMPLSSAVLEQSASMEVYDWTNFYLEFHEKITAFLKGTS
jgi:hypothetical protein